MKRIMSSIFAAALLLTVLCACGNTTTTAVKEDVEDDSGYTDISTNKKETEKMYSRVYVEITDICNRNCSFCPGTKRAPRRMSIDEFRIVAEKLKTRIKK